VIGLVFKKRCPYHASKITLGELNSMKKDNHGILYLLRNHNTAISYMRIPRSLEMGLNWKYWIVTIILKIIIKQMERFVEKRK